MEMGTERETIHALMQSNAEANAEDQQVSTVQVETQQNTSPGPSSYNG